MATHLQQVSISFTGFLKNLSTLVKGQPIQFIQFTFFTLFTCVFAPLSVNRESAQSFVHDSRPTDRVFELNGSVLVVL